MKEKEVILRRIEEAGVLAVLRGPSEELTIKMVDALVAAGVIGIEITFTTPNALSVIEALAERFGDEIILGAGTVTKETQAAQARDAGATFLVSPHTEEALLRSMVETNLPIMSGALTPSEVTAARSLGADVVKIFPGSLVGPSYIKALKGPYPDLKAMPTGGVNKGNIGDWFAAGAFAVGAGGNLCPKAWAIEGRFSRITENAQEFLAIVKEAQAARRH
ncbi:MAG: bifunctional 4-hydroxy-2-oxoglutarate aldolase/2-dehydro-3-deoxy-phosphogluconate aldolase [Chloroflexota bacterium]|jgi:2-dehydro-3-deoxyphosphogluconate aldolase/(4S)-4-hydroxy-2-oxoglutarate aldolase